MKNYVYIFHVESTMPDTDESNAAWGTWYDILDESIVDGGNPFNPKAEAHIKNGVVNMDADTVAGYTIVKAESLEQAVEMAKSCPLATGEHCWVSVHETMPM